MKRTLSSILLLSISITLISCNNSPTTVTSSVENSFIDSAFSISSSISTDNSSLNNSQFFSESLVSTYSESFSSINYNEDEVVDVIRTILKKYEDGTIDLETKDSVNAPPKYQKLPDDWKYPTLNNFSQLKNVYYNSETGSLSCDIECDNIEGIKVGKMLFIIDTTKSPYFIESSSYSFL